MYIHFAMLQVFQSLLFLVKIIEHYVTHHKSIFSGFIWQKQFQEQVCVCVVTKGIFLLRKFSLYEIIEQSHSFRIVSLIPTFIACSIMFQLASLFLIIPLCLKMSSTGFCKAKLRKVHRFVLFQNNLFVYIRKNGNQTKPLLKFMKTIPGNNFHTYSNKKTSLEIKEDEYC